MKKLLVFLLALSFLAVPTSALAKSRAASANAYKNISATDSRAWWDVDAKADRIDWALTVVNTDAKTKAKLQKKNVVLDNYMKQANLNITRANNILDKKSVSKSDINKVRRYLALAEKLITNARYSERDLRIRLKNLGVNL